MPNPYVDDDGKPRFGVRVSPEELERIRREQGIESPDSSGSTQQLASAPQIPEASDPDSAKAPDPFVRKGRHVAEPASQGPRYGAVAPGGTAADTQPAGQGEAPEKSAYGVGNPQPSSGRMPSGIAAPPPGGWSWQKPGVAGYNPRGHRRAGQDAYTETGRPGRRWGLFFLGLLLMIVVPAGLSVGAVASAVDGSLTKGTVLTDSGQVYLDADSTVGLYSTYSASSVNQCKATSPKGESITPSRPDVAGAETLPYASLTAKEEGLYTISCDGGTEGLIVGPALDLDHVGLAGTLMLTAVGCGVVGLGVTIAGIVRLARPRS